MDKQPTPSQKILEQLTSLALSFATHVTGEKNLIAQVDAMYKILVTGNGALPLPEIVRGHTEWIAERDAELHEDKADKKEILAQNKKDTREDRVEAVAAKRQWWILAVGEMVMIGLFILTYLKK